MPDSKPIPPAGYQLTDLPDFLRESNKGTKTISAPQDKVGSASVVAEVDPDSPTTIKVREPSLYTAPVRTHESTHVYQMSRNPDFASNVLNQPNATGTKDYDYGGVDGLLKAQAQRKTIADFSAEQQATMVADYQRLTAEALKKHDAAGLSKITSAYHPFISQLSSIPPKGADMKTMTKQDLTPAAPSGVPSAPVAGMLLMPDPLIGGDIAQLKAQAARLNPSATGRKIGDTKKFANGTIGKWDGYGWRLAQ